MHDDHAFLDFLGVALGTTLSLLTSEKTLIFVTIVFTLVRLYILLRRK